jgi:shikimate kinase
MFKHVATTLVAIVLSASLVAGVTAFPASFHTQMVPNGTSLYVRVGGKGPAVVLLLANPSTYELSCTTLCRF